MKSGRLESRRNLEKKQTKKGDSLKKRLINKAVNLSGVKARGLKNALDLKIREFEWRFPRLPKEADGMRLLHISDTHLDGVPGLLEALLNKLNGLEYDYVCWTGDFRYDKGKFEAAALEPTLELARFLLKRSRVFAVPGNHDCLQTLKTLENEGVEVLLNRGFELQKNFYLAGTDDPHYFRNVDFDAALSDRKPDDFTMALVHSPEVVKEASELKIDFYLCGHTHGGQVCLPWIGIIYWGARCARRFAGGRFEIGQMQGYTHKGTGASNSPIRFNCPPEVVVHTLRGE